MRPAFIEEYNYEDSVWGKIWLEFKPDHATTFYFTSPGIPDKE
jgi:hypothetical protein